MAELAGKCHFTGELILSTLANVSFPEAGYYEVWARATDSAGVAQPFAIDWNPKGYLNNTMHRVGLKVG